MANKNKISKQLKNDFNAIRSLEASRIKVIQSGNQLAAKNFESQIRIKAADYIRKVAEYTTTGIIENIGEDACIDNHIVLPIQNAGEISKLMFEEIVAASAKQIAETSVEVPVVEVETTKIETITETTAKEAETMNTNNQNTFVYPELIKGETSVDLLTAENINKETANVELIFANMRLNKAKVRAFEDIELYNTQAENDVDGSRAMLYSAIVRYCRIMSRYKADSDDNGILTQHSGMPIVDEMSRLIAKDFFSISNSKEEAQLAVEAAVKSIENASAIEKESFMNNIILRARGYGTIVWDVVKGVFKYIWNGVCRIVRTSIDIITYVFGACLSLVDAATTKDFGASGNSGLISSGMNAVSERMS